jgi:hypothetical protein
MHSRLRVSSSGAALSQGIVAQRIAELEALRAAAVPSSPALRRGPGVTRSATVAHVDAMDVVCDGDEISDDENIPLDSGSCQLPVDSTQSKRTYHDKVAAAETNLRNLLPQHVEMKEASGDGLRQLKSTQHACILASLQQRITAIQERPDLVSCCLFGEDHGSITLTGKTKTVIYMGFSARGELVVPELTCGNGCKFWLPAVAVGCYGSSPIDPKYWVDEDVLVTYNHLRNNAGLSETAFCKSLNEMFQHSPWLYPPGQTKQVFDDSWFEDAFRAARAILRTVEDPARLGVPDLFPGPFGRCGVCASFQYQPSASTEQQVGMDIDNSAATFPSPPPQPTMSDEAYIAELAATAVKFTEWTTAGLEQGVTSPDYADLVDVHVLMSADHAVDVAALHEVASGQRPSRVAVDGAMKFTRYRSCGSTHTAVCSEKNYGPLVSTYFGNLNDVAEELIYDVRRDTPASTVASTDSASCGANLRYAREYGSKATVLLDDKCVAGMVCDHVVPGVDLFISSSSHENYQMMDLLLGGVLADRNGEPIDTFCFDCACRYKQHVRKDHPNLAAGVKEFAVGWVHANAGHNLDCQLNNSAMYKPETGRCNGEWTELLWVRVLYSASCLVHIATVDADERCAGWDEALGSHLALRKPCAAPGDSG